MINADTTCVPCRLVVETYEAINIISWLKHVTSASLCQPGEVICVLTSAIGWNSNINYSILLLQHFIQRRVLSDIFSYKANIYILQTNLGFSYGYCNVFEVNIMISLVIVFHRIFHISESILDIVWTCESKFIVQVSYLNNVPKITIEQL